MSQYDDIAEGHEIPLHVALTQRILIAGIPRLQFYIVTIIYLVMALSLHQWMIATPLYVIWFFTAKFLTARDPYFTAVSYRAFKHVYKTSSSGGMEG